MDELYMEWLMQEPEYMMQLEWEQANVPSI